MANTINTSWLQDDNGDKFAPKTLIESIQDIKGVSLSSLVNNASYISGNKDIIENVNIIDNNIQLIDITDKLIPTTTTFATDYQYKLYKYGCFCKFYCSGSVASGGADAGTFFPLFDLPIEYAPVMVTANGCLGGADRSFGLDTAMRVYQIEGEKVRIFANTGWWMCGQLEWIIAKEVNNGD